MPGASSLYIYVCMYIPHSMLPTHRGMAKSTNQQIDRPTTPPLITRPPNRRKSGRCQDLLPVETTVLVAVTDRHLYVIDPAFAAPSPRCGPTDQPASRSVNVWTLLTDVYPHTFTYTQCATRSGHMKHFSEAPPPFLLARHPLRALDRVVVGFRGQWGRWVGPLACMPSVSTGSIDSSWSVVPSKPDWLIHHM